MLRVDQHIKAYPSGEAYRTDPCRPRTTGEDIVYIGRLSQTWKVWYNHVTEEVIMGYPSNRSFPAGAFAGAFDGDPAIYIIDYLPYEQMDELKRLTRLYKDKSIEKWVGSVIYISTGGIYTE